eukprot:2848966-Pyramimonas_sp.AAC.1
MTWVILGHPFWLLLLILSLRVNDMQPLSCSAYWLEHMWHRLCSVWFPSSGAVCIECLCGSRMHSRSVVPLTGLSIFGVATRFCVSRGLEHWCNRMPLSIIRHVWRLVQEPS